MKRLVKWLFLIPVALLVSVFAISNRQSVPLGFSFFPSGEPLLSLEMPLYLVALVSILVGILIGGLSAWIAGGEVRGHARRLRRKTRALERDLEAAKAEDTGAQLPST